MRKASGTHHRAARVALDDRGDAREAERMRARRDARRIEEERIQAEREKAERLLEGEKKKQ